MLMAKLVYKTKTISGKLAESTNSGGENLYQYIGEAWAILMGHEVIWQLLMETLQ